MSEGKWKLNISVLLGLALHPRFERIWKTLEYKISMLMYLFDFKRLAYFLVLKLMRSRAKREFFSRSASSPLNFSGAMCRVAAAWPNFTGDCHSITGTTALLSDQPGNPKPD